MGKMESSHTGGPTSADEPALSLREVLLRLTLIDRLPKNKVSIDKLFGLLKAGQLNAGFYFPATKIIWISIPQEYWTGLPKAKFRSLRYLSDESKSGTYEVSISDFIDQYMAAVSQLIDSAPSDRGARALEELEYALSASQKRYEVAVRAQDWKNYLERNKIAEPAVRETRGRRPKESWHHLAPIIAGYMMTLDNRTNESRDHDSIAKMILQLAKKDNIPDLPAVETLADVVSKAFDEAKELGSR